MNELVACARRTVAIIPRLPGILAKRALSRANPVDQSIEFTPRWTAYGQTLLEVHDRLGEDFIEALGAGEVARHALDLRIVEDRSPGLVAEQRADPFRIVPDQRVRRHVDDLRLDA